MKRSTLLALAGMAVLAGAGWYATAQQADARQTVEQRLRVLEDKQAITETINKIAVYADRRQWDIVAAQFAPGCCSITPRTPPPRRVRASPRT